MRSPGSLESRSRKEIAELPLSAGVPYVEYDETQAVCPQCGAAFRSPDILEEHLRDSHGGPAGGESEARPKRVACSVCGARLPSVSALQRHNQEAHMA